MTNRRQGRFLLGALALGCAVGFAPQAWADEASEEAAAEIAPSPSSTSDAERLPPVVVRGPVTARPTYATGAETGTAAADAAAVSPGPLALSGGPTVPLRRGGSMDVLTPQRIHEATVTQIDQIVDRLPGAYSRLYSGDEYLRPSISVRGMPDNGYTEYTAVLVDGINYSSLFYGWTALSIFPYMAERTWAAEIYRGAHAIRFGPNTVGGVINFITSPIPVAPTLRTRIMYGSYNYQSTATEIGGTDPRSGFGFLATFVQKSGDTFRQDSEFAVNEFALKTIYPFTRRTSLAVNGFYWDDHHQIPGRLSTLQLQLDPTQNPNPREVDWNGWAYGVDATLHHDFNTRAWTEAQAYYRAARRDLDSGRPSSGPPYTSIRSSDSNNYNLGVEVRGAMQFASGPVCHGLHWGVRYHNEWIDRWLFEEPIESEGLLPPNYTQDARTRTQAISAYVDDEIRWRAWTLGVGARLEWIPSSRAEDDITGDSVEFDYFDVFPGVSLAYQLTSHAALFANYHQSFRAPQVWAYEFGNPDQQLDFEQGQNVEVGGRIEGWRGLDASVALWYVDFSDFIDYDPLFDTYTNLGAYHSYGVDLTLNAEFGKWNRRLRGWSVFGSVTRQESKFASGEFDGNYATHVPKWVLSAGTRYQHCTGLYGVLETNYWGGAYVTPENDVTTPSYWIWDARVGWRKSYRVGRLDVEVDLAGAVKNLTDSDYALQHRPDQWVPGAPRQLFLDLSFGIDL